MQFLHDKDQQ